MIFINAMANMNVDDTNIPSVTLMSRENDTSPFNIILNEKARELLNINTSEDDNSNSRIFFRKDSEHMGGVYIQSTDLIRYMISVEDNRTQSFRSYHVSKKGKVKSIPLYKALCKYFEIVPQLAYKKGLRFFLSSFHSIDCYELSDTIPVNEGEERDVHIESSESQAKQTVNTEK